MAGIPVPPPPGGPPHFFPAPLPPPPPLWIDSDDEDEDANVRKHPRPSAAMKEYFNSEKHSDLTIRFGEKEMKAHKIAVCSQSKYFAKCCEGQFQEAASNVIELKDDDPATAQAMLEHLYGMDYKEGEAKEFFKESDGEAMAFHVKVCITADKYDVASLKEEAGFNFREDANRILRSSFATPHWGTVKKLKTDESRGVSEFASTVRMVFQNTLEGDYIRDVCIATILKHEVHLWRVGDIFTKLMDDIPAIAVHMAKRKIVNEQNRDVMTVRCMECSGIFTAELPNMRKAYCLRCGESSKNWYRRKYYQKKPTRMSRILGWPKWKFWRFVHLPKFRIRVTRVRDDVSSISEV